MPYYYVQLIFNVILVIEHKILVFVVVPNEIWTLNGMFYFNYSLEIVNVLKRMFHLKFY